MIIKRLLYFGYYLKETDIKEFLKCFFVVKKEKRIPSLLLCYDIIYSSFKYNISILEYFYFRFFRLTLGEREEYAGTGFMYEYQLIMNPRKSRSCLNNKIVFLNKFSDFIVRGYADIKTLKIDRALGERILSNISGKLVLKKSRGQCGEDVHIEDCFTYTYESLIKKMERCGFDLLEEYVVQHPSLMALSSSGLNTIRIITQFFNNKVVFLGARLRISVNSHVDNLAAGNIAAAINLSDGVVNGPGVYIDITKEDVTEHPVSHLPIQGFQIPYWKDTLDLVERTALLMPDNRSVGWDVAISAKGPELIEGNHNWCKLLWQLPVKRGLKKELDEYL